MSFLDDILDVGSSIVSTVGNVASWFTGSSTGAQLARTAMTGLALNQVQNSINKTNEIAQQPDPGVRLQVDPDPEYKIPVVYGQAVLGGAVTDAQLSSNNAVMHYCLTLCEKTGALDLGAGSASDFEFLECYWEDNRIVLDSNGHTVTGFVDRDGTFCDTIGGCVDIYFYSGNSNSPKALKNYSNPGIPAYSAMINWDNTYLMSDLVFAVVVVRYDATKGVRGLGRMKFKIRNSMTQPGDCIYDYMTNTRYGAGIAPREIYTE